jgi:hypothetical protein
MFFYVIHNFINAKYPNMYVQLGIGFVMSYFALNLIHDIIGKEFYNKYRYLLYLCIAVDFVVTLKSIKTNKKVSFNETSEQNKSEPSNSSTSSEVSISLNDIKDNDENSITVSLN